MKIALLVLLLAIVLGGLIGALMVRDPGYVLLAYDEFAVETSLWFAVLMLVLGYLLIRLLVFVFARLARGSLGLGDWHARRRARSARDHTVRGLLLMEEGEWAQARRLLEGAAPRVTTPLINYLGAARAAHHLGDAAGRDRLLGAAHESTPGSRFAVGLTQAELQRSSGQWEQCLATLLELRKRSPNHPQVLRMLVSCNRELEDWAALIELAPQLRKHRVMEADAVDRLLERAWRGRFADAREDPDALWQQVGKEQKRAEWLVAVYARRLAADGRGSDAERVVRHRLNRGWDEDLVRLYGTLASENPEKQLVTAESWLKERPNDADLLLTLGRISLMNRLWARAREYLEASLRLKRTTEVQGELGRLCAALGEGDRGSEHLVQALPALPALPLPDRGELRAQDLGA